MQTRKKSENPSTAVTAQATLPLKHIPELDGIRGVAIIFVMLYHYIAVPVPPEAGAGFQIIRQILSNGWSGVDLFFVLSGFLITRILLRHRKAKNYYQVFYIRRIARIFPLYYLFLLVFASLRSYAPRLHLDETLFSNVIPLTPYFFYLQNVFMVLKGSFGNEFLAITWSLAVEEQFYLFLPWLIRRTRPVHFRLNVLFFIVLPLILRWELGTGTFYSFVLTPWRLDALFLGALLAVLTLSPALMAHLQSLRPWIWGAFWGLFTFFVHSSMTEGLGSLDHLFVFALFYATLILLSLLENTTWLGAVLRNPVLRYIGSISYGIYILHQLVNGLLHYLFFGASPTVYNVPTLGVTLLSAATTFLLASGTYYGFEKRFIAWGHRFSYQET